MSTSKKEIDERLFSDCSREWFKYGSFQYYVCFRTRDDVYVFSLLEKIEREDGTFDEVFHTRDRYNMSSWHPERYATEFEQKLHAFVADVNMKVIKSWGQSYRDLFKQTMEDKKKDVDNS